MGAVVGGMCMLRVASWGDGGTGEEGEGAIEGEGKGVVNRLRTSRFRHSQTHLADN